jgi:hypothetical protein
MSWEKQLAKDILELIDDTNKRIGKDDNKTYLESRYCELLFKIERCCRGVLGDKEE